ncbi:hypothetical protein [Spirosoma sp. 48-14]|uniref:hypothetical protein n=1 Tax=Spirosoma sp. 48-14 TaxID=1895854 RepID=UPI000966999F|nr:hypothetical protein [Spirosoma sp. 48-14]OJW75390.1 MAG: hypothetical protein BGO59_19865 [Spirosoma sp. 48-14]
MVNNKPSSTAANNVDTSSIFWAMELEINTDSRRKDIASNPSDAEVILQALMDYQQKLYGELDEQKKSWVASQGLSQADIIRSFATGELACTLEQIKVCNTYINLIATHLGVDLRRIGNAQPKKEVSRD